MSSNKVIVGLQKQNDGIYSSLNSRGIQFERIVIPNNIIEEEHLNLLKEENIKLKDVANANKPPQLPKEEKKKQESQPKKETKAKDNKEGDEEEYENEETLEEPIKKFDTITNMEDIKRAFFSNDYETFETQIKMHPFKFYKAEYKYNSDKDGVPDFSAKNLLKGFVRNLDDYRKYFMVCFRCWKYQHENKYKYRYVSLWIVNSNSKISDIIDNIEEDFDLIKTTDIEDFILSIKKLPETDFEESECLKDYYCIGESYVH